ncbi:hypothetical protein HQ560_21995, partial [bacterium]|nr:hypothetical protein [bacterium]
HYYARKGFTVLYLDCARNRQADWWWGWHAVKRGKEQYATTLCPAEKRALSTIEWVIQKHDIDRNRVYLSGISMGGSGSLGIGMCRGDIFAAVAVAVPAGIDHVMHRMAQDHPDPPLVVDLSSHVDNWAAGQERFLGYCKTHRYPVVFAWGLYGHTNNVSAAHPAAFEFPWLEVRRNEAIPVFTNASTDDRYPGLKNRTAPDQAGQRNAVFRWRNVSDTTASVTMEFWLVRQDELTRKVDVPREAVADVTLRRLQKFAPQKGTRVRWRMQRGKDTLQSGTVQADAKGLLTIPRLKVTNVPDSLVIALERQ